MFDVPSAGGKRSASAENTNHRAGDGGHDEQQHHHGHGPVPVVESGPQKSVPVMASTKLLASSNSVGLALNPFAFAYFATHGSAKGLQVIGIVNCQAAASLIHRCR